MDARLRDGRLVKKESGGRSPPIRALARRNLSARLAIGSSSSLGFSQFELDQSRLGQATLMGVALRRARYDQGITTSCLSKFDHAAHNGLSSRRSAAASAPWPGRCRCPTASMKFPLNGPSAPMSMRRNTKRFTRVQSGTPTDFGASTASASIGSSRSPGSRTRRLIPIMLRSSGMRMASPTPPTTASIGICRRARSRQRSSGRATTPPSRSASLMLNCTTGFHGSPMCCARSG